MDLRIDFFDGFAKAAMVRQNPCYIPNFLLLFLFAAPRLNSVQTCQQIKVVSIIFSFGNERRVIFVQVPKKELRELLFKN